MTAQEGTTFKNYTVTVTVYIKDKNATTENIANIVNVLNDGDDITIKTTDENK